METAPSKLPWYFRPGRFWGVLVLSVPFQLAAYATTESVLVTVLTAFAFVIAAFYLSWPFLLYEYLAPNTLDSSRHWSGRNKIPITIIIGSLLLIASMTALGINTEKPNEIADLMVFPVLIPYFLLNWRACDLLVSLERQAGQRRSVIISFIAMFYIPLTIWWFYSRLKMLQRSGRI